MSIMVVGVFSIDVMTTAAVASMSVATCCLGVGMSRTIGMGQRLPRVLT